MRAGAVLFPLLGDVIEVAPCDLLLNSNVRLMLDEIFPRLDIVDRIDLANATI